MLLDLSVALFYASLGMSAAAVVLFLWLMREPRDAGHRGSPGSGTTGGKGEEPRRPR